MADNGGAIVRKLILRVAADFVHNDECCMISIEK